MPIDFSVTFIVILVLAVLVTVFLALAVYYAHRHWYYTKVILPRTKNWVFLEIQMPKDNSSDNSDQLHSNEEAKKNLKS